MEMDTNKPVKPLTDEERELQPAIFQRTRHGILRARAKMGYPDAIEALRVEFWARQPQPDPQGGVADPRYAPPAANGVPARKGDVQVKLL
jgi:hypothetical protein